MSRRATNENLGLPPLTGAFGRLLRGPGRDIAVEVMWQSGAELTLSVLAPGGEFIFPAIEELVLECSSSRGMTRLAGQAMPADEGRLGFAVHDVIEVEQRRRFVRVRISRPIRLARSSDGAVSHTFALDLSGGGLLLAGPDRLQAGEHVSFRMRLEAGGEPIEGYARVVRVAGSGNPAVTFDSIKPADRERLIHFIFDCERRARALRHAAAEADPPSGPPIAGDGQASDPTSQGAGDAHEPGASR